MTAAATRSFETSLSESWLDYYRDNREALLGNPLGTGGGNQRIRVRRDLGVGP